MNLHKVVAGSIAAVNPHQRATLQLSTGYTTNSDGSRVPTYGTPIMVTAQVQSLSTEDLQKLAELNVQGSTLGIYITGMLEGVVRPDQKGGDLITLRDEVWLTTTVIEQWPDWVKVSVKRQIA